MRNELSLARIVTLLLLIPLEAALAGCSGDAQSFETRTLPSGRVIRVKPVWKQIGPEQPAALMLNYETQLKIADKTALRSEVDEIWAVFFRKEAEEGQFKRAVIVAQEIPEGRFVLLPTLYSFTYDKQLDGSWLRSEYQRR